MLIFADTCKLDEIEELLRLGLCDGATSNPTLLRLAGVTKVTEWARDVITAFGSDKLHLSVPVLAEEDQHALLQVFQISELGPRVYAKVPHQRTAVWKEAAASLLHVNVTAITKSSQFYLDPEVPSPHLHLWASVFAGRIADTGTSPVWAISHCRDLLEPVGGKVIWASTREVLNFYQAHDWGCGAITATPALIKKWDACRERGLDDLSNEAVKQFSDDAAKLNF